MASEETRATTDDDHLLDPGRLKPREHQDAVEALLRQFRPAVVRYCRARLARNHTRTGSLDEDDVAQEVCLALLSALPSYRDMGRPFGAFVFAIAAHKVADAARGAARAPLPVPVLPDLPDRCAGPEETVVKAQKPGRPGPCWPACPPRSGGCSCSGWWRGCPPRTRGTCSTCRRARSGVAQHRALGRLRELAAHEDRTGELGAPRPGQPRPQ